LRASGPLRLGVGATLRLSGDSEAGEDVWESNRLNGSQVAGSPAEQAGRQLWRGHGCEIGVLSGKIE